MDFGEKCFFIFALQQGNGLRCQIPCLIPLADYPSPLHFSIKVMMQRVCYSFRKKIANPQNAATCVTGCSIYRSSIG